MQNIRRFVFRFTFFDICFDGKVKRDYKRGSRIKNGSTVDSHGAREEVRNIALREKICSHKIILYGTCTAFMYQ